MIKIFCGASVVLMVALVVYVGISEYAPNELKAKMLVLLPIAAMLAMDLKGEKR